MNCLDAAVVLARASRLEVDNVGGTVSAVTRAQEGDSAMEELQRLHLDVSVVCPAAVNVGASAFVQFARLDQIDLLAVAGTPDPARRQPFLDRGVTVSAAPRPHRSSPEEK
jgi:DeoR family fructose operon transcriptional repressor